MKFQHNALPEDEQREIIKRRLICTSCPFVSSNAVSNPQINYKTDRLDEHCMFCKCNIEFLTAALEHECGLHVYNEENPDSPIPLKWVAFEKPKPNGKD